MIEPITDKNTTQILKGIFILVTRPKVQSEKLAHLIQHHGGHPIIFPSIEIKPVKISKNLAAQVENLDQFKYAIFTSYYAVDSSIAMIKRYWPSLPSELMIAAIGARTAQALSNFGITVDLLPQNDFSSEALLELPSLKSLTGEKIILFGGKGGRQLLQQQLVQRGADLTEFVCYQRLIPQLDLKDWEKVRHHQIDVIICTSVESLKNLFQLIAKQKMQGLGQQWRQHAHWLFISKRVKKAALELGIKNQTMIADKPTNEDIINTLIQFAKDQK